ncbi:MAG: OpgC domain-containing protein [Chloroflexia bacterium]
MATSAERQETAPQDDDSVTQVIALPGDDDVTRGGLFPEEDVATYGGVLSGDAATVIDGAVLNDVAARGVPFEDEADTAKGKAAPGDELTLDVGLLVGNDPTLDVGFPAGADLLPDDLLPVADPGPPGSGGDSGVRRNVRLPERAKRVGWRYVAEEKRDLRLDLLRGFAVFAMVVDHIGGASWLYALTGGNRFFVLPLLGVRLHLRADGRHRVWRPAAARRAAVGDARLLARAWTLYVMAVWLAIGTAFFTRDLRAAARR